MVRLLVIIHARVTHTAFAGRKKQKLANA